MESSEEERLESDPDTLDKRAEWTMMYNIANALVEIPFYEDLKRIQRSTLPEVPPPPAAAAGPVNLGHEKKKK